MLKKLYVFSLTLFLISTIFTTKTELGNLYPMVMTICRYLCCLIIVIKIIICDIKKYDKKTWTKIILLTIICTVVCVVSGNRMILQYLIVILGSYEIEFKKIVKYVMIGEGITVLGIIVSSLLGILPNIEYGRTGEDVIRYSLGFEYSTYPAIFIYYLTLLYLFYRGKKAKIYEYIIIVIINTILYKVTDTKTELICVIMAILLVLIYNSNKIKWFKKSIIFLSKYIIIALTILSIILAVIYNPLNDTMYKLNKQLSGRLYLSQQGLKEFGINLFGKKIEWVSLHQIQQRLYLRGDFNYVDNAYLNIMYNYGIILLALLIIGFYKIVNIQVKKNNDFICCFIIVIAIHSFINPQLLQIVYNIFLLLLVDVIITPKKEEEENYQYMNLNEIHEEEIKMLKQFTEFCEKNKLQYYICGGTLLGAIRHKGFIPWDDDVDILMPREEYDKLQEIGKINNKIGNNLEIHSFELNNLNDPFCKIMNLDTQMNKYYIEDEYDCHLWLDVFPMDGLVNDEKKLSKTYKKVILLRRILVMMKAKDEIIKTESKTKVRALIKPILRFLLKPIGAKGIAKMIVKISKKYKFNDSEYVGGIAWGYGPQEKLKKEDITPIKVEFEGMQVDTFACYNEYLTNLYGDYMKLPPKEEQIAHIMKVRKIENEKEVVQ